MGETAHSKFTNLHKEKKLLDPIKPAHVLVSLALNGDRKNPASKELAEKGSGQLGGFVDWEDAELKHFRP